MTIKTLTFGCRLNAQESDVMRLRAHEAGLDDNDRDTGGRETVLVNTCAVTGEAVRQARQAIRRARRQDPDARIIVSGCAAQIDPHAFAQMPEVDLVLGNDDKLQARAYRALPEFGTNDPSKMRVNDIMSVRENAPHMVRSLDGRSRAFVQVQNGCDHRCTFCIIPYGRGNSRSLPVADVVGQIRLLNEAGYLEAVLTGVDLTSWGADLEGSPRLGDLVAAILRDVPGLARLRLSSIDSIEADPLLMEIITAEERLMPHLHLSLQHGDDLILKRMKRRHSRADAIAFCQTVRERRPGMVFGADLMAGFPTETDEHFENTLSLVSECGLSLLHVFPFSPRPGTPAARMPRVDPQRIRERAARLRETGASAYRELLDSRIGTIAEVLIEENRRGRTPDFLPVQLTAAQGPGSNGWTPGEIAAIRLEGHDGEHLSGTVSSTSRTPPNARQAGAA